MILRPPDIRFAFRANAIARSGTRPDHTDTG